jgi:DNA repair exonuclease SbcCD ATPase subunit
VLDRVYEQLSGGQRRCVELAFSPLALSDTVFARLGVRVPLLVIDELTTHLGEGEKRRACELLASLGRKVFVIDHDPSVQGHFDHVLQLERDTDGVRIARL